MKQRVWGASFERAMRARPQYSRANWIVGAALGTARIDPSPVVPQAPPGAERAQVRFDRFSAHRERSDAGERLSVSLRLRTGPGERLSCFVFVVARNDHVTPRVWSIWPPQPPGPVITVGGHFHGANPAAGHPLILSDAWQRLTATVPYPPGGSAFDTVVVYVLTAEGRILLARPFSV